VTGARLVAQVVDSAEPFSTPDPGAVQPYLDHHGDHLGLLVAATPPRARARLDAIVVPTARPVAYLREAIRLARELDCPLIALCSKWADAAPTIREAQAEGAQAVAADLGEAAYFPLMADGQLRGTRFWRDADTSVKRNIGLAVARMMGWRAVLFLDDDIAIASADDIGAAASFLDRYDCVGLTNVGYPDNSVVCHAHRAVGGLQTSFIGGGAMLVAADRAAGFFPNIYNEDWFFLLDDDRLTSVARTGRVVQKDYDPFADPRRARYEELGDCLAEGIYRLLDDGRRVQDADHAYWHQFLASRRRFINGLLHRVPDIDEPLDARLRMIESLKAARGRLHLITPELCASYLEAWREDRASWAQTLRYLPRVSTITKALHHFGLYPISTGGSAAEARMLR